MSTNFATNAKLFIERQWSKHVDVSAIQQTVEKIEVKAYAKLIAFLAAVLVFAVRYYHLLFEKAQATIPAKWVSTVTEHKLYPKVETVVVSSSTRALDIVVKTDERFLKSTCKKTYEAVIAEAFPEPAAEADESAQQ